MPSFFTLLTVCAPLGKTARAQRLTSSEQQTLSEESVRNRSKVVRLVGTCRGILSTHKRRQSWVFTFKVVAVLEGKYEEPFRMFERYQGGAYDGQQLIDALGGARETGRVADDSIYYEMTGFDRSKEIELVFESWESEFGPRFYLKEFRARGDAGAK